MKSNYEIVSQSKDFVVLRDIGPWDHYMTITNNADDIVADLFKTGMLTVNKRLLYYDSENNLDEILLTNKQFAGFKPYRDFPPQQQAGAKSQDGSEAEQSPE